MSKGFALEALIEEHSVALVIVCLGSLILGLPLVLNVLWHLKESISNVKYIYHRKWCILCLILFDFISLTGCSQGSSPTGHWAMGGEMFTRLKSNDAQEWRILTRFLSVGVVWARSPPAVPLDFYQFYQKTDGRGEGEEILCWSSLHLAITSLQCIIFPSIDNSAL